MRLIFCPDPQTAFSVGCH